MRDIAGKVMDADNKRALCARALKDEAEFVSLVGSGTRLDIPITIHPDKTSNPYVQDLQMTTSGMCADLKKRETPFYTSNMYGVDPQYAFTINDYDLERYASRGDTIIYMWAHWDLKFLRGYGRVLRTMNAIHVASSKDILGRNHPIHYYVRRQNNDGSGNKRSSVVFDIRNYPCLAHSGSWMFRENGGNFYQTMIKFLMCGVTGGGIVHLPVFHRVGERDISQDVYLKLCEQGYVSFIEGIGTTECLAKVGYLDYDGKRRGFYVAGDR